jgi:hypothetical protein
MLLETHKLTNEMTVTHDSYFYNSITIMPACAHCINAIVFSDPSIAGEGSGVPTGNLSDLNALKVPIWRVP